MLQRDYLMRMTEMLAAVLSKILLNKENKNYAEAEKEIESAAKTIVGLDLKMIDILSIEDIMKLLKSSELYAGRCFISAELMYEFGESKELQGNENESINLYLKSLRFYIEALLAKEIPDQEKYYSKTNNLISKLSSIEFSGILKNKLMDFYELSGQYSKAEDLIFQMMEDPDDEIKKKAVSFYKRLNLKTDEELISGNLSREEIEDSLEEISKM
ncbi:MAG TPA: DUF6483 family protein [Ignavibacteria bacterium]|nr:DUF6483 family protein [Ignavibacteria bacterium]